jgi:hypothetical protein
LGQLIITIYLIEKKIFLIFTVVIRAVYAQRTGIQLTYNTSAFNNFKNCFRRFFDLEEKLGWKIRNDGRTKSKEMDIDGRD